MQRLCQLCLLSEISFVFNRIDGVVWCFSGGCNKAVLSVCDKNVKQGTGNDARVPVLFIRYSVSANDNVVALGLNLAV